MNDKERIEKLIFDLGIDAREFSRVTGIGYKTIQDILDGKKEISLMLINRILRALPHLNENFLKKGEGEMFITKSIAGDKYFNRKVADAIETLSVSVLNNSTANLERAKSEGERARSEGVYAEGFNRLTIQFEKLMDLFEIVVRERYNP